VQLAFALSCEGFTIFLRIACRFAERRDEARPCENHERPHFSHDP